MNDKILMDAYCPVSGSSLCHGTRQLGFVLLFQTAVELKQVRKKGRKTTVLWRPGASA